MPPEDGADMKSKGIRRRYPYGWAILFRERVCDDYELYWAERYDLRSLAGLYQTKREAASILRTLRWRVGKENAYIQKYGPVS
jgi:hypothetical protein